MLWEYFDLTALVKSHEFYVAEYSSPNPNASLGPVFKSTS